jgi:drug/metabolite transporter (DMT)-like permease
VQAVGLALALAGVVLASREEVVGEGSPRRTARGAGLAMISALGFGCFFLGMDKASDADVAWAMLVNRVTGFSLLLCAALVLRPPVRVRRPDIPALLVVGTLDIAANATFAIASTKGLVSVVSVLGSLYPLTTVGLAAIVLGERPHRLARVGVVTALVGVALVAAG